MEATLRISTLLKMMFMKHLTKVFRKKDKSSTTTLQSSHMDYTSSSVTIKSFNHTDTGTEILYTNNRKAVSALLVMSHEQVIKALASCRYIIGWNQTMVNVPMPVFICDVADSTWLDLRIFMHNNLDEGMAINLLLYYLNKIAV